MKLPSPKIVLLASVIVPAILFALVMNALVFYGMYLFPGEPAPRDTAPEQAALALWLDAGGRDPMPAAPATMLDTFSILAPLVGRSFTPDPVQRMAGAVAQTQLIYNDAALSRLQWRLAGLVGTMTVARQWTPTQMAAYLAPRVPFGPERQGFDAAAEAFFDRPVHALSDEQILVLAAVVRSPGGFNPWCRYDALQQYVQRVYGVDLGVADSLGLAPAPPGECAPARE